MLLNIPYNVFASSNVIEDIILKEDDVPLDNSINIENVENNNTKDDLTSKNEFSNSTNLEDRVHSEILDTKENSDNLESLNTNIFANSNDNSISNLSLVSTITNYADHFAGGDGTEQNPYQISNALELTRLAYLVNEEKIDTTNMYFELISNIDLSDFDSDTNDTNGNWTPIGYSENTVPYTRYYFKGIFNGNNYTIDNMSINANLQSVGLFGYTSHAHIKNLTLSNVNVVGSSNISSFIGFAEGNTSLENININISSMTASTDYVYAGGLIAFSLGNNNTMFIDNCNVVFDNKTSFKSYSLGGFIGYHSGGISVTNSSIKGSLDSTSYVGGIIANYDNHNTENIVRFDNLNIELDIISNNTRLYGGGIAGLFYHPDTSTSIEISNINFKGSLTGGENCYFGGLFASLSTYSSNTTDVIISNCNIEILDLKGYKGGGVVAIIIGADNKYNFKNINSYIKGNVDIIGEMGGIVGGSYSSLNVDYLNILIEQPLLKPSMCVGGIVGWIDNDLIVNNSNLNFNVTLNPEDTTYPTYNYLKVGGVVGLQYCNILNIINTNINMNVELEDYPHARIGGFAGLLSGNFDNDVYIKKSSHNGNLSGEYVGGISGDSSLTSARIEDFYLIGNKKANSLVDGIFNITESNKNTIFDLNNFYIVGIIEDSSFNNKIFNFVDKDCVTANIKNAYYDNSILNKDDEYIRGLTTLEMQGIIAKENMPFDYDNVWKLNRDYYPTFNQLNTAPELSGNDIELILNQDYDLLDYITIEDFEDKNLVPEITTDLDITKIGDYTATFTVTDPKGLSDTLTLNIKVVMENPIINAEDIEIFVNEDFDEKKGISATDVDGTNITEHIKVIENTVNTKVPGIYKVVYQIDSLYKATIQKEIKVIVKEKTIINDDKDESKPSKPEDTKVNTNTTTKPQTKDVGLIGILGVVLSVIGINFINKRKED